tara:strand:- start:92 stop:463 length:372 start_codon:yes stop_codon:yes gene_type:complete
MQTINMKIGSSINVSLQVGDAVYYSPINLASNSGFSVSNNNVRFVGIVTAINPEGFPNSIDVIHDDLNNDQLPENGDYIMFGKNKTVNSSNVKGYYANVKFVNYSKEKVELFSVGSEVSQSSK